MQQKEIGHEKQKRDVKIDTKDQWAQFIIKNSYYTLEKNKLKSNILTHKKDEFTKDFDKINQFVLTNNICKY